MDKTDYKLSVEGRLTGLEVIVAEIKDNHLVHIQDTINRIQWLLVGTLCSMVTGLIFIVLK